MLDMPLPVYNGRASGDDDCAPVAKPASPLERRIAWLLRIAIVATTVGHVLQGQYLYTLICVVALGLVVAPPLLARTGRANVPIELELAVLWWMVADMSLGRLGALYDTSAWFDKALHFGNSVVLGMLAFLFVYALHMTGRLRTSTVVQGLLILLVTLGFGAFWEIVEYVVDQFFARGAQGSPIMAPLDDTMWDLILDGMGGLLGALLGPLYIKYSTRSHCRVAAFAKLLPDEDAHDV
jgi:hypothetical protein